MCRRAHSVDGAKYWLSLVTIILFVFQWRAFSLRWSAKFFVLLLYCALSVGGWTPSKCRLGSLYPFNSAVLSVAARVIASRERHSSCDEDSLLDGLYFVHVHLKQRTVEYENRCWRFQLKRNLPESTWGINEVRTPVVLDAGAQACSPPRCHCSLYPCRFWPDYYYQYFLGHPLASLCYAVLLLWCIQINSSFLWAYYP